MMREKTGTRFSSVNRVPLGELKLPQKNRYIWRGNISLKIHEKWVLGRLEHLHQLNANMKTTLDRRGVTDLPHHDLVRGDDLDQ